MDDKEKSSSRSELRYLWAYSAGDDWARGGHQRLIKRRQELGYDVSGFCVTPICILTSPTLSVIETSSYYNGANLHPECDPST